MIFLRFVTFQRVQPSSLVLLPPVELLYGSLNRPARVEVAHSATEEARGRRVRRMTKTRHDQCLGTAWGRKSIVQRSMVENTAVCYGAQGDYEDGDDGEYDDGDITGDEKGSGESMRFCISRC